MMAVAFNDLHRAYSDQRADLDAATLEVLDSGWYVMGPQHDRFEQAFADHLGVAGVAGVASGTDALTLILTALAARHADDRPPLAPARVLCAANAGGYTTVAAARAGLRCTYVDVDPATHCLDPAELARALEEQPDGVAAVVVTHLYGRMADIERIAALCAAASVPLVEDCAQATGARSGTRVAGSFGTAAAFSFYPTKNLGALGDGGAVATDDGVLLARIKGLRQYGWDSKYHLAVAGGMNSRLDEVQAAVLNVRLPLLDGWNARRRSIISAYRSATRSDDVEVLAATEASHVAHLAVVVTPRREELRRHLAARGIGHDIHYPVPDHLQPAVIATHPEPHPSLPVTERLASQVLSVPCFPQLRDDEIDEVCDALASF